MRLGVGTVGRMGRKFTWGLTGLVVAAVGGLLAASAAAAVESCAECRDSDELLAEEFSRMTHRH